MNAFVLVNPCSLITVEIFPFEFGRDNYDLEITLFEKEEGSFEGAFKGRLRGKSLDISSLECIGKL